MKHKKFKNTGILFELLSRSVMHEVIGSSPKQTALMIIKKYFKSDSELLKELKLYQALLMKSEHNPTELIELTIQSRKGLNEQKLQHEKYELIKSLKKHYDLKVFFESRLSNYKLVTSIYKLFEDVNDPVDYLNCKKFITEQLSGNVDVDNTDVEIERALREQDGDVRRLTFRYIVEQFNDKYKQLNPRQKKLLSLYINEDDNSTEFKSYIMSEVQYIVSKINSYLDETHDDVTKIKLREAINLTETIISAKHIKDEHLSGMLKYYELIEEIQK
jgi:hypothetical protein